MRLLAQESEPRYDGKLILLEHLSRMKNSSIIHNLIGDQPKALAPLFMVELWERFGFYVIQGILVLYLSKVFHLSDSDSYSIFSLASAFMYATPFIGGYIADRILGYRHSILIGSILLALGYWALILQVMNLFYLAIGFIVVGNGFLKSCISTLVGLLYTQNDPRRDAGYTIFYMGINIGSLLAPLMSGYVSQRLGWGFVFGFTGAGLVIAFFTALLAFKLLGKKGLPPRASPVQWHAISFSKKWFVALGTVIAILLVGWLVKNHHLANMVTLVVWVLFVASLSLLIFYCKGQERKNMFALMAFLFFSIIFWAIYMQCFSSVNLFTDRIVDRHLFGYEIPTVTFQSIDPFFIVTLTFVFARVWPYVNRKRLWLASGAAKFCVALGLLGLAFFVLLAGIFFHYANGTVNMLWVVLSYFLQAAGELCLSPIGLALVSELAPEHYRGMMMGAWMLSISAGYSLGNVLSQSSSVPEALLHTGNVMLMEGYYTHAFTIFASLAAVSCIVLFFLTPSINRILPKSRKTHREENIT